MKLYTQIRMTSETERCHAKVVFAKTEKADFSVKVTHLSQYVNRGTQIFMEIENKLIQVQIHIQYYPMILTDLISMKE